MISTSHVELLRAGVDRIVRSEEFRNPEVLRRLLLYLAEKAATGEGDKLKGYVVAIDGLGKPSSYDPQHNAAVRIQVGRLQQKLAKCYRNEGLHDPLIVELPKVRVRLVWTERAPVQDKPRLSVFPEPSLVEPPAMSSRPNAWWPIGITALLCLALGQ